jgi:hypothetical protein
MIRLFIMLNVLFCVLSINNKVYANQALNVNAKVKSVAVEKYKESFVSINIEVIITLYNKGKKTIMFFNKESYPNFCGIALFTNSNGLFWRIS